MESRNKRLGLELLTDMENYLTRLLPTGGNFQAVNQAVGARDSSGKLESRCSNTLQIELRLFINQGEFRVRS